MAKLTHEELREKLLARPEVEKEYKILLEESKIFQQLANARIQAGMTQNEVAQNMHTSVSAVGRLETMFRGKSSPKLSTIKRYIDAIGAKLEFKIILQGEFQKCKVST